MTDMQTDIKSDIDRHTKQIQNKYKTYITTDIKTHIKKDITQTLDTH